MLLPLFPNIFQHLGEENIISVFCRKKSERVRIRSWSQPINLFQHSYPWKMFSFFMQIISLPTWFPGVPSYFIDRNSVLFLLTIKFNGKKGRLLIFHIITPQGGQSDISVSHWVGLLRKLFLKITNLYVSLPDTVYPMIIGFRVQGSVKNWGSIYMVLLRLLLICGYLQFSSFWLFGN